MKTGDIIRVHIAQDAHGHGGFIAMGTVVDENDHNLVLKPLAFLLVKNDVGAMEELPEGSQVEEALRTVQVGRESYLGKTTPAAVTRVGMADVPEIS